MYSSTSQTRLSESLVSSDETFQTNGHAEAGYSHPFKRDMIASPSETQGEKTRAIN